MNDTMGRSMRFCEECGVALHIMTREAYVKKYMVDKEVCPYCGKAVVKTKESSEGQMS